MRIDPVDADAIDAIMNVLREEGEEYEQTAEWSGAEQTEQKGEESFFAGAAVVSMHAARASAIKNTGPSRGWQERGWIKDNGGLDWTGWTGPDRVRRGNLSERSLIDHTLVHGWFSTRVVPPSLGWDGLEQAQWTG